jgi:hypothetical protein
MKSGASENDIFGDDSEEPEAEEDADEPTEVADVEPADHEVDREPSMSESEPTEQPSVEQIPYKFRRSTVKEDRQHVPLYLRDFVLQDEKRFRTTVEEQLGEDVPKADLREAAYIVAQRYPDLVADELRKWGFDIERNE